MPFIDHQNEEPAWINQCRHPEHNPPGMIVLPAGHHTWQCPGCGAEQIIKIRKVTLAI